MAAVELATGYVSLVVETSDVARQVGRMFTGVEGSAGKAGKAMGQAMAKGLDKSAPDMDKLAADVDRARQRMTQAAEQSARKQEASARKVEIAEAKVREALQKSGTESSQYLTAVDRLSTAQQKLEAETMDAADAQRKLRGELDKVEGELKSAESASKGAADGYARGWRGIGQKISRHLKGGVEDATEDAERVAEKGGREAGGGFKDGFKGAVAGLVAYAGVEQIIGGVWKSVQSAGDMEQSIGAIDSVFKESAGVMHKWSRESAAAVGLSSNEFNELGTLIGAQLKNGGTAMDELAPKTNDLIGLGADLSSMFGGSASEAVEALSSALKGERDPIEKYGVSLNQAKIDAEAAALGFEKVGGSLSAEANQAATLSLIMKQTADAHGNFARESDTFAHKQQVAGAQWENLTVKIGELFLPVLTNVFGFLSDKAMPILGEVVGGIRSFGDAFKYADGDVTSAGFPGEMEKLGYQAALLWQGFEQNLLPALQNLARFVWDNKSAVVAFVGALVAFKILKSVVLAINAMKAAVLALNTAMKANLFGIVVVAIAALVAGLVWAYHNVDWFRAGVDGAFRAVGAVVGFVWGSLIKPVFGAIVGFVRDVLAPIFTWLFEDVIGPVFGWIGSTIGSTWKHVVWPIFSAIIDTVGGILGGIFTWLYESKVKPVFDAIGALIRVVWTKRIKPVFKALGDFIQKHVVPAVEKGVDGIRSAWQQIQDFAKKPIKFVIDTVINSGLIGALNTVRDWFGLNGANGEKKIKPISIPGFATGGYTGPGGKYQEAGVVHAGEFVLRKEATERLRNTVGLSGLNYVNRTGELPAGYFGGGYVNPVNGPLTSRFGESRGRYPHAGIDWAVPIGTIVRSALDGVVERIGTNIVNGRTGKGMLVGHEGGKKTYYGHLSAFLAAVGQKVRGGESIAKSGNTGRSTGPHLHFETWQNGQAVDPLTGGGGLATGDGGGGGFNPLAPLFDLVGNAVGGFKSAFPAGGVWADTLSGGVEHLLGQGIDWAKGLLGGVGDFLSPTTGGILDTNKGSKDAVKRVASGYGWGDGQQWSALHEIVNRESSWRVDAANPSSSARGLFQKMTSAHGPVEPTAEGQARWGLHYIASRYGSPLGALAHHDRRGWYADGGLATPFLHDNGGWHMPGTYSYNGLKKPEAVLTPDEAQAFKALAASAATDGGGVYTGGPKVVVNQEIHTADPAAAAELARAGIRHDIRKIGGL